MKTDNELKQLLAKMLPEQICWFDEWGLHYTPIEAQKRTEMWLDGLLIEVKDTELLHICWLIEMQLDELWHVYATELACSVNGSTSASWQQRTTALAHVKGLM